MEPLQTFVNNGIALLDKEMGPRWPLAFKGHLARMNMERCNRCALGILFGEYDAGLDKICPVVLPADLQQYRSNISKICAVRVSRNPWAALHGFTLWNYKSIEDDVWKTLTDLWKKEISSRIEAIKQQDAIMTFAGPQPIKWLNKITELIQQRKEENNAITNTIFAEPHGENRRPKTEAELQGRVCSTR